MKRPNNIGNMETLKLMILMEGVEFTKANPTDTIIKLDVEEFYKHCENKLLNYMIEETCKNNKDMEKNRMRFLMRIEFFECVTRMNLYNVDRIRSIELFKKWCDEYSDYLNK